MHHHYTSRYSLHSKLAVVIYREVVLCDNEISL